MAKGDICYDYVERVVCGTLIPKPEIQTFGNVHKGLQHASESQQAKGLKTRFLRLNISGM